MPLQPTQEPPYYEIITTPTIGTKKYIANLSYAGAGQPPDVDILYNTLGSLIWTESAGTWIGTLAEAFTGKLAALTSSITFNTIEKIDNDSIRLTVFSSSYTPNLAWWNENQTLEITVYP